MLFLAVPMTVLFLMSEVVARLIDRRRAKRGGEGDYSAYSDDEASEIGADDFDDTDAFPDDTDEYSADYDDGHYDRPVRRPARRRRGRSARRRPGPPVTTRSAPSVVGLLRPAGLDRCHAVHLDHVGVAGRGMGERPAGGVKQTRRRPAGAGRAGPSTSRTPPAVVSESVRHDAHQAWVHGQVLLLDTDSGFTVGVPGTGLGVELLCEAIRRFARGVGAAPTPFTVAVRL
jgi:hypothetical protein